jgi:hypothetical protein
MTQQDPARVLFAVAAEGDDEYIWSRLKMLPELFAAGPVAIRVGFFGAEGTRSSRPFMVSRWTTNPADLADLLEKARTRCICGCYVRVSSILEQALRETQQGPLRAVVIVGDSFYGDFEAAIATAERLRAAGTRLFLFQQGASDSTERSFRLLAETTGGAYFPLNPHVERLAERLPGLLEAVTHFALGGMAALEARGDEAASLLLERMNTSNQMLTKYLKLRTSKRRRRG